MILSAVFWAGFCCGVLAVALLLGFVFWWQNHV